jgi:DNA-binding GntR family transcriptional regulator
MQKGMTYQSLKSRILSEELSPGVWLVERDISQTYSLSRTPVREILRTLASEGLVSLVPSRGYTVKKLSLEEIVNIFQAREAIDATAARLSCVKGDKDFLSRIQALTEKLEKLNVSKDSASGVVLGNELHATIVAAVNNPIISEFYEKLKNLSTLVRNITKKSAKIEINSRKGHLAIANAILKGDEVASEETMREHLRGTCRLLVDSYLIQ